MFFSNEWKDYELIECSDGERLERWGKYILIRPDPQVIWKDKRTDPRWNTPDGVYKRIKGGGNWVVNKMPESWNIRYKDLSFKIKPMGFKHTGIFPEQASNWDFVSNVIRERKNKSGITPSVLNMFAYTGAATVACSKAGATVVHVDASKGMVSAAKENMELSGLGDSPCRYIVDDCKKFIEREIRRGNRYDGIIMDPPSYGRGPNGELWTLENSVEELIRLSCSVLSDEPVFFLINSYTKGLSPMTLQYILHCSLPDSLKSKVRFDTGETCIPVKKSGLFLPSGASVRATF